jgi:hypothetical protein
MRMELLRVWKVKKGDTNNNGGTGTITKLFRKYRSDIPGKHEIRS